MLNASRAFDESKMAAEHATRRIILLGKTGVGKATLANRITGTSEFKVHDDLESITRNPVFSEPVQVESPDQVRYTVQLLDTTGLVNESGITKEQVVQQIKTSYLEKGGEGDALVIFVVAYGRFTDEEWDIFRYVIKKLSTANLSVASALVVTKCEDLSEEARDNLVLEIRHSAQTGPIVQNMYKGIHPVGFPDIAKLKPELSDAYEDGMKRDEETLHQLLLEAEVPEPPDKVTIFVQPSSSSKQRCVLM